ncbi:MAG: CpsB/CapC family capsule biosynthesis tyrosine phosphatase [Pseudomonadota bacterium]
MFDLHCHLLPGIDDGPSTLDLSLQMARAQVDQGVTHVACTPHILPGVYHNRGPQIREAVAALQRALTEADIPLTLVTGADNHVDPAAVHKLQTGEHLTLNDSRYVLVEPPHHVAPARLDDFFFNLKIAGYVPVLTHPERLTWIEGHYDLIASLADRGIWMQITSGSLRGKFGRRAKYWADRMLCEGRVHILATDAHNMSGRRPDLAEGQKCAADLVGVGAAEELVVNRPRAILVNEILEDDRGVQPALARPNAESRVDVQTVDRRRDIGIGGRVRRLFGG